MTKTITVTSIIIVALQHRSEIIFLNTKDLPAATWPFEGTATLKIESANGQGQQYCETYFPGVPLEIVEGW